MAKKQQAKKVYDKTNTCMVNVITSKTNGKKYSLFIVNIAGKEMTGIINGNTMKCDLRLERDGDIVATAQLSVVKNQKSVDSPSYRGTITTIKGNKFECALWERFGDKFHFWSGVVKPEGEGSNFADDDGSKNPFLQSFAMGEQTRAKKAKSDDDDLPF